MESRSQRSGMVDGKVAVVGITQAARRMLAQVCGLRHGPGGGLSVFVAALVVVLLSSLPMPPRAYAVNGPDLSIGKQHYGGFYVNSPMAAYTFYVPNAASAGPTTGPITLTDTLPTGITFNSIRATSFSDWVCSAVGQALTCTSPVANPAEHLHRVDDQGRYFGCRDWPAYERRHHFDTG